MSLYWPNYVITFEREKVTDYPMNMSRFNRELFSERNKNEIIPILNNNFKKS
jgi:hypothetical protein